MILKNRMHELLPFAKGVLNLAESKGLTVRLIGGLAFWERCPGVRERVFNERIYKDFDLAATMKEKPVLEGILTKNCNLVPDSHLGTIPAARQSAFRRHTGEQVCDVYYDVMRYCHDIKFKERLMCDALTLPLAELFLSKMQIADAVDQDVWDVQALLAEHEFGDQDGPMINLPVVIKACTRSWGLEWCLRANCEKLAQKTETSSFLTDENKHAVMRGLSLLKNRLEHAPRSLAWHCRACFGTLMRPYRVIEPGGDTAVFGGLR